MLNNTWSFYKEPWFIKHVEEVLDTFKAHQIISETENSWFVAKKTSNKFTSIYYYEVIALKNGRLFIGGDINDVVYAYGPSNSKENLLKWIATSNDFDYLCSKAKIGSNPIVSTWSKQKAVDDLKRILEDTYLDQEIRKIAHFLLEGIIINTIDGIDYQKELDNFDSYDANEILWNIGCIPSNTILYSWAAARHLYSLL